MIVDVTVDEVLVPLEHVKDGQIVLNIGPQAIRDLSISDEYVMFSGRLSGVPYEICVPIVSVIGIIAKENGGTYTFIDPATPTSPIGSANP